MRCVTQKSWKGARKTGKIGQKLYITICESVHES